jgi:hypothetical protein
MDSQGMQFAMEQMVRSQRWQQGILGARSAMIKLCYYAVLTIDATMQSRMSPEQVSHFGTSPAGHGVVSFLVFHYAEHCRCQN